MLHVPRGELKSDHILGVYRTPAEARQKESPRSMQEWKVNSLIWMNAEATLVKRLCLRSRRGRR